MRILVTGGCGFIGSHLVDVLLARGDAVTVLDDLSSGTLDNLKTHMDNPALQFIHGDIRDTRAVEKALTDVEAVIHEAAIASVPLSIENPSLTNEVNVSGTLNLLTASLKAKVKRFVYASSSAVYGAASELPIHEDAPLKPLSPYGASKLAAEKHCESFYKSYGLETVRLRYFNVYGPRQTFSEYAVVMVKFLERIRKGQAPIIYGDGEQTRDFIYITDVVDATLLALNREGAAGEVFNIGTGEAVTINRLCGLFLKALGRPDLRPAYEDAKPGDIRHSQADITKARRVLGFQPKISLEQGIKEFIGT